MKHLISVSSKPAAGHSGSFFLTVVVIASVAVLQNREEIALLVRPASGAGFDPTGLILLGLPAALLLWVLRLASRLFSTNLTLQSDASGRVAMTETFLAMVGDQKVEPDDRMLILQALFRPPAVAGGAEEDHAPPSVLDAFVRQFSGKSN